MHRMRKILGMVLGVFLISLMVQPLQAAESPTTSGFHLGPGDVLLVSVWKDEELTREVVVRPDGKISFPLAGEIQAEGQTIAQLQEEMTKRIQVYVPDTPVTVMLQQLQSTKVFVVGKVANPGMFIMQGKMTVLQALSLAGGLTRFADKDGIHVIRKEGNKQTAISFDYGDVSDADDLSTNVFLRPGDTVVVP